MISTVSEALTSESLTVAPAQQRRSASRCDPLVFAEIYAEETNIVTWQRSLTAALQDSVRDYLHANSTRQLTEAVSPKSTLSAFSAMLGTAEHPKLTENIAELVDMFCCLFGLTRAGLRLTALDRAMCPKFHVDRVPCRLVTTYRGSATQWLPHQVVDRTKLGRGSKGLSDSESGLYPSQNDIQQLTVGDVALLKGESWAGNENAGLVHRSPAVASGEHRLLLTLDFID